jgi:glycosyltransferase involved in cell wall biosynthesis
MLSEPISFSRLKNARVAIVLTTLDLGGAERQALHLASYLRNRCGAKVAVVGLFGGLGDQPIREMCIERRLPCLRVNMPEHENGVPTFRSIRQFARDMAFLQLDILLPYTSLPNVLCGVAWQRAGAKACIWNQRDEGRQLPQGRWHNLAIRNSTHFISNSREGAEFLTSRRGVPQEKIDLIYNGVVLPPAQESRQAVRHRFALEDSNFVVAMLANLHEYKDHATLVCAWKRVCEQLPNLAPTLLLAGREDDDGALAKLVTSLKLEQRIRMLGPVSDVSSLLHAVDLSVFSSFREGTPNAVLESMAAGRAVVATDIPGCRDALGSDYPALVPKQDPTAITEQMIALAKNPGRREDLGASLQTRAAKNFSVSRMCEQTCRILQRLLEAAGAHE